MSALNLKQLKLGRLCARSSRVFATGPTLEDTRRLIAEAIEFHIDGLHLSGEPVPEPTSVVEILEVRAT